MVAQYGSTERGQEFLQSLLRIVDIAAQANVRNILHGGDLLDAKTTDGDLFNQLLVLDAHARDRDVTIWVATGNHDLADPPFTRSLEVHAVQSSLESGGGLRCLDNLRLNLEGVSVVGLPFLSPAAFRERLQTEQPADILVAHHSIREFMGFPSDAAVCLDDFPVGKFKVVLLGDLHIRDYRIHNSMFIGYPGSSELASKSEAFEKSVTLLEMEQTPWNDGMYLKQYQYIPIPTRYAVGYRIMNELDLAEVCNKLRELSGRKALVFVSYNPQLQQVRDRLHAAVNPRDVILQDEPLAACSAPPAPPVLLTKVEADGTVVQREVRLDIAPETSNDEVAARLEELEVLSPRDFLPALLPESLSLQQLAMKLMDDPAPDVVLESWALKREDELMQHETVGAGDVH